MGTAYIHKGEPSEDGWWDSPESNRELVTRRLWPLRMHLLCQQCIMSHRCRPEFRAAVCD